MNIRILHLSLIPTRIPENLTPTQKLTLIDHSVLQIRFFIILKGGTLPPPSPESQKI